MFYKCSQFLSFIILTSLLIVQLSGCEGNAQETQAMQMPPTPVEVMSVSVHSIPINREYVGHTQASHEVEVHTLVSGIIQERLYKEGQRVEFLTPLFNLYPDVFDVKVEQAKAELERAKAELARAKREKTRLTSMAKVKAVSQSELDNAISDVELYTAEVHLQEANLKAINIQRSYANIVAPIRGIAGLSQKREGALVTAGNDSLLTTIIQTDPIDVVFSISENEWLAQQEQITRGLLYMPNNSELVAKVQLSKEQIYPREGEINFQSQQIDASTGTYLMRARFPNPDDQLRVGQFVRVLIQGAERRNTIVVPQTAVLENSDGKYVYVVSKNDQGNAVAEARVVEVDDWINSEDGKMWMLNSGLKPGDQIIIDNLSKLRPGSPINITATRNEPEFKAAQ